MNLYQGGQVDLVEFYSQFVKKLSDPNVFNDYYGG